MTQRSRHPMPVVAMLPNAITHARLPSPYRKHAPRRGSARNCQCVVADGNRRDRRRKCLIAGTVAKTQTKLRGSCERTSSGPVSTDASKDPISGVHAARVIASGPVSHRLECLARRMRPRFWLVPADGGSFPRTWVLPGLSPLHLSPAVRMLRAAFASRSWTAPQSAHTHRLTTSMSRPEGPARDPQLLHAREVFFSLTTLTLLPACLPLYCSCVLSIPQPESSTDFAIRVLASLGLLTSPTTMNSY